MKMGVETPDRLIDINRLPLARIEELPEGKGVRIGALARNSDVAEHPLITQRYPVLERGLARRRQPAIAQYGHRRRQSFAAHALPLFLRS